MVSIYDARGRYFFCWMEWAISPKWKTEYQFRVWTSPPLSKSNKEWRKLGQTSKMLHFSLLRALRRAKRSAILLASRHTWHQTKLQGFAVCPWCFGQDDTVNGIEALNPWEGRWPPRNPIRRRCCENRDPERDSCHGISPIVQLPR